MTEKELTFCEKFESKSKLFSLLKSLQPNLTEKAKLEMNDLEHWLYANVNVYLKLIH